MTIYGESDDRFRPRPTKFRLTVFSLAAAFLTTIAATSLFSQIEAAIRYALVDGSGWSLFAGLADFVSTQPLGQSVNGSNRFSDPHSLTRLGAALLTLLSAMLAYRIWPTGQSLAARLFSSTLALSLSACAFFQAISVGTTPILSARLDAGGLLIFATALLLAGAFIFSIERSTNDFLTNVYSLATPAERMQIWLLRIALPFATLGALAFFNQRPDIAASFTLVLTVTLLVNLSTIPRDRYEELKHPEIREAAATLPLIALILSALSIYMFGLTAIKRAPRILVISSAGETRLVRAQNLGLKPIEFGREAEAKDTAPIPEKKIEIKWSKPRARPAP